MVVASAEASEKGLPGRALGSSPIVLTIVILAVAFAVAFLPSIRWVFDEWSGSSGVLSHGILIAVIAVYLFVRAVPGAASLPVRPRWSILPVLLALSLLWLLGYAATVVAVQTVVLPAILLAAITTVFGFSIARYFAFPVLFMYFALPALEHLQFVFQRITVVAVQQMIRAIDISAHVKGNFVHIPEGTFAVDGGCSGLNFVIAGLSLAALYGYLYHHHWWQTVRLAMLVLAVSMLGNWVRVFGIVNIGYFYGMDSSIVTDHLWLGWTIFAVFMIPVFFIARRFELEPQTQTSDTTNVAASGEVCGRPTIAVVVLAIIAMTAGPIWARVSAPALIDEGSVVIALPVNVNGWQGPQDTLWGWQPEFYRASAERIAEYKRGKTPILVYANVYLTQTQGRELISFRNSVLGNWQQRSDAGREVEVDVGGVGAFRRATADTAYGRWIILYRNVIAGKPVTGNFQSKVQQAIASLQGNSEAGVIAFAIPCGDSCPDANNELGGFIAAVADDATVKYEVKDGD